MPAGPGRINQQRGEPLHPAIDGDVINGDAALSQHHHLLQRFIEREHLKGDGGDAYLAKPEVEKRAIVAEDFQKLGAAALGMFNRQALHISRADLDNNLTHFGLYAGSRTEEDRPLSAADLVFGSFFFVHESRTKELGGIGGHGSTAFEFLTIHLGNFLQPISSSGRFCESAPSRPAYVLCQSCGPLSKTS
jgi:hypothetical protein